MYLLDTNILSEFRKIKSGRANPGVAAWALHTRLDDCFLSVIVLHELQTGLLLLERHDPKQADILRTWIHGYVIPEFRGRTLGITPAVALRCSELHIDRTRPVLDSFIASTAYVHGLAVVTRNIDDFKDTGVALINPWTEAANPAR